jgi:thiamine biosynthesis protein ThiC
MSKSRRDLDWQTQFEPALFHEEALTKREASALADEHIYTLCGPPLCVNRRVGQGPWGTRWPTAPMT